jgi:hypothetical protein
VADSAVTAASTCDIGGALPTLAPNSNLGTLCKLAVVPFSSAGNGTCSGTSTLTAAGKCSNGALPTCPRGYSLNPNGNFKGSVRAECVACLTGTRLTAVSGSGPFVCLSNCPSGTSLK